MLGAGILIVLRPKTLSIRNSRWKNWDLNYGKVSKGKISLLVSVRVDENLFD